MLLNQLKMKTTALHALHQHLGAKMVPFGGFEMPVSYRSIKEEHQCVRQGVGVFDVSHMGEFFVEGPQAFSLLQHLCSNDIKKLVPGKAQYNYFPNHTGGVVDDLIVYQLAEEKYLLVVNAANIAKDWAWITQENATFGATLTNASDDYSLLAVQGPKALAVVQELTSADLATLPYYAHCTTTVAQHDHCIVATTGYTGSGGVEIYCSNAAVEAIWKALFVAGASAGIQPIGLAARDTLRLEMGYCLYGHELDDTTSPIAAGLGWVTRPETGFINAESIGKEKVNGSDEQLFGIELLERGIPRQGHALIDAQGTTVGRVTSGTQSPSLNKAIGLAFVAREYAQLGNTLFVGIRNKKIPVKLLRPPFYRP